MLNYRKFHENLSLLTDFYELTMAQSYFDQGKKDVYAYFDLYFRRVPQQGGYVILAGLSEIVSYLESLKFSQEDLSYLRQTGYFSEEFLAYLRDMEFSCDIFAIPEGTVVFPNEPLIRVHGPLIQAQIIETMLLLCINHQSLIATKASRITHAASGRTVFEFGARRAQGSSAAIFGARAAYIGGIDGSSCTLAGRVFDVPVSGTMAHSYVLAFSGEYEAFLAFVKTYPDNSVLLVDTYSTLHSGIPNAIRVAKEVLEPMGKRLKGIRIDSGDLAYLSQRARVMLDEAGMQDCQIVVSNALDEFLITNLLAQGASIDAFGVGEQLITSRAEPVLGGVYKMVAILENGQYVPKIKMSDNETKITTPCAKQVYRFYDKDNMALADLICEDSEESPNGERIELFHPVHTWKRKELLNVEVKPLLRQIFSKGKRVIDMPTLEEIRLHAKQELNSLWPVYKRFENPETYIVDLSYKLWATKNSLLHQQKSHIMGFAREQLTESLKKQAEEQARGNF